MKQEKRKNFTYNKEYNSIGQDNDFDLLVIVSAGMHRRRTAQKIYRNLIGVGFASYIIIITEDDIEQFKDN